MRRAAPRPPSTISTEIEVSRRIERDSGSAYRINGKEVRARDVQLLFADAATGAHSPALVSQGRIGQLINDKPRDRRVDPRRSRRHQRAVFAPPRGGTAAQGGREQSDAAAGRHGSARGPARQPEASGAAGLPLPQYQRPYPLGRSDASASVVDRRAGGAGPRPKSASARPSRISPRRPASRHRRSAAQADANAALQPLREAEAVAGAVLHRLSVAREFARKPRKTASGRRPIR